MNDDKSLLAEMLGIKGHQEVQEEVGGTPIDSEEDAVDELDVQREVVQEMARDNAELKELHSSLEEENRSLAASVATLEARCRELTEANAAVESARASLESEKAAFESEKAAFESEKQNLQERLKKSEAEAAELKLDLEEVRGLNSELEQKLVRMGKALFAVRRAAAEAAKVEIGGRRW